MSGPELSVVVCSGGRSSARRAVASSLDSAAAAGADVEALLVWQASSPPPELPAGARVLEAFPAGLSYARNRGLAAARAPVVAYVDDGGVADSGWVAALLAAFAAGADAAFGPVEPADAVGWHGLAPGGDVARWVSGPRESPWRVGSGGNMAVRSALLRQLGGFDQRLGRGAHGLSAEATHVIALLQRLGARIRWVPGMRVVHPAPADEAVLAGRHRAGFGVGRMVRQLRSVGLAARFGADVARAGGAALRGRRRAGAREAAATLRGFTAGALRADGWRAPVRLLERLPAELRPHVEGRRVHGWPVGHGAQPHFLYGVGEDRVLHVYADAPSFLDEAVALRAELGDRAALLGAPALVAAARTATALWVLEARVHGRTVAELPLERWWQPAVGRVLAMGDVRGPRLSATGWWREARRELPGVAGPGADAVAAALDRLAGRPATLMHGDLQPKNLLWQDGGVAVIDWNGAMAHGVPGCDLLFLALTARGERPDARAVARLARGEEPLASAALAGLGLAGDGVAAALLVSLALWTREERSRLESLGTAPQPPVFAPLLAAMVPELAPQLAAAAAA